MSSVSIVLNALTITAVLANSADDKLFFLFFPENMFCHFMQIVSLDNLHEMTKPVFWEK